MPAPSHRRPTVSVSSLIRPRLVIAGLGHVGLHVARDAVTAGYPTIIGFGAKPEHLLGLITGLAAEDHTAAVLAEAIESGRCRITDDARSCAGFYTAVLAADRHPVDPAETGPLEQLTVALAPHVRPGVLVVAAGTPRPRADGALFSATVELLTGMRAGTDYDFGYTHTAADPCTRSGPTIVSGIDDRSARRIAALHHNLGHPAAAVNPAEAAELVATLQVVLMAQARPGHGETR